MDTIAWFCPVMADCNKYVNLKLGSIGIFTHNPDVIKVSIMIS